MREIKLAYIDVKTNQQLNWEELTPKEKKSLTGEFVKLFNTILKTFFKMDLSKGALKLAIYIWVTMLYCNRYYYDRTKAAKVLNTQPSNVSTSLKELIDMDFCILESNGKIPTYIVNPDMVFKGADEDKVATSKYYWKLKYQTSQPESDTISPEVLQFITASEERQIIVKYLKSAVDSSNTVHKQVNEIVQDTKVSKPSVIKFLKFLEEQKVIFRPQRGQIKINGVLW